MQILTISVFISSISFLGYALAYFTGTQMKSEFKRFGLEKLGLSIIVLEILGACGLLVGLKYSFFLILSSLGLALLMLAGIIVRIRLKDKAVIILPALFYMILNTLICLLALEVI